MKKQREQRLIKMEQKIQGMWYNYKRCNINIRGIPEGEEREQETEEILEKIMTGNFCKLMSDTEY